MDPSGSGPAGPSSAAGGDAHAPQHQLVQPLAQVQPQQAAPPQPPPRPQRPQKLSDRSDELKRRDWDTFLRYLQNHQPPLTPAQCRRTHVMEFLSTKVHHDGCAYFGLPSTPAPCPCPCPLRQDLGPLDALIGRLRAAYEESGSGHAPESNPFSASAVRLAQAQARAMRGPVRAVRAAPYDFEKKKRKSKQPPAAVSGEASLSSAASAGDRSE